MSIRIRAFAGALFAGLLLSAPAFAHSVEVGSLSLTDLWTRATPPGAPTAGGYLTIANKGSEPDKLIAASTPQAEAGELHIMEMKDNVMTMKPVEGGIAIPAGGSVTLAPSGLHIMFVKLKAALKEGDKLPVTLTFEKAGKVDTFLHIMAVGADGPDAGAPMDHSKMNMGTTQ
jgi:copper(I)-binding protein